MRAFKISISNCSYCRCDRNSSTLLFVDAANDVEEAQEHGLRVREVKGRLFKRGRAHRLDVEPHALAIACRSRFSPSVQIWSNARRRSTEPNTLSWSYFRPFWSFKCTLQSLLW